MEYAVYGTLKHGHGNHRILEGNASETDYVVCEHLEGTGFPLGHFKNAEDKDNDNIWLQVEIYTPNEEQIQRMNSLEGKPHFYDDIEITTKSGRKVRIYQYQSSLKKIDFEVLTKQEHDNFISFSR